MPSRWYHLHATCRRAACVAFARSSLLAFTWATHALAYRPFDGTDADVVDTGEVELELGPVGWQYAEHEHELVAPAVVANYGLAPRLEAVVEARHEVPLNGSKSRVEDGALLLKGLLLPGALQGRAGLSVAVESGLLLPHDDEAAGAHLASIISWLPGPLALHLNLNNDLWSSHYVASASLIAEGPFEWSLRPVAELSVGQDMVRGPLRRYTSEHVLGGGVYRWSDALYLDAAVRAGKTQRSAEVELRAGLTWSFATH